jgi:hypothetical protein
MADLRAIQARNRGNPDVRTLLLEIKRMHHVLRSVDDNRETIEKVWKEQLGTPIIAFHIVRSLLSLEPVIMESRNRLNKVDCPIRPQTGAGPDRTIPKTGEAYGGTGGDQALSDEEPPDSECAV